MITVRCGEKEGINMKQGQFQVYTGDGKGKTTAAIGLAVRAAGSGESVYIGQFIKDMEYHEIKPLRSLGVVVELYGTGKGCLIDRNSSQEDREAAQRGLKAAAKALESRQYGVVILDEINVAWQLGLVKEEEMLELLSLRSEQTELVFTGRGCPDRVLEQADLITEMRPIRHYYQTKGLLSREGIEC